jgi:hypothetical protein
MPYPVTTICGSMRFYPEMLKLAERLTAEGQIVLMPFVTKGSAAADAAMLDEMHRRKIDMSDSIHVVTGAASYVGDSTRGEIDYARSAGKAVYTEATIAPRRWSNPKLPDEPPMTVVRVADPSDDTWWHIRPNQWYPACRCADRIALANLRGLECDTWSYVLRAAGELTDDTRPGERPLTELQL